jgi:hypothetical protein
MKLLIDGHIINVIKKCSECRYKLSNEDLEFILSKYQNSLPDEIIIVGYNFQYFIKINNVVVFKKKSGCLLIGNYKGSDSHADMVNSYGLFLYRKYKIQKYLDN